jgi:hypothetical protein
MPIETFSGKARKIDLRTLQYGRREWDFELHSPDAASREAVRWSGRVFYGQIVDGHDYRVDGERPSSSAAIDMISADDLTTKAKIGCFGDRHKVKPDHVWEGKARDVRETREVPHPEAEQPDELVVFDFVLMPDEADSDSVRDPLSVQLAGCQGGRIQESNRYRVEGESRSGLVLGAVAEDLIAQERIECKVPGSAWRLTAGVIYVLFVLAFAGAGVWAYSQTNAWQFLLAGVPAVLVTVGAVIGLVTGHQHRMRRAQHRSQR